MVVLKNVCQSLFGQLLSFTALDGMFPLLSHSTNGHDLTLEWLIPVSSHVVYQHKQICLFCLSNNAPSCSDHEIIEKFRVILSVYVYVADRLY